MIEFNLTNMNYEQLCKLEKRITEVKKTFISMDSLYVFDDKDKVPHLCYISHRGNGTNPNYVDYYSTLNDVFDNSIVGRFRIDSFGSTPLFIKYLVANSITCDAKYCTKDDLRKLWDPIRVKMLSDFYDKMEKEIKDKRAALL